MKRWMSLLFAGALAIFTGADAFADVVGPPPDNCAPGFEPATCHGGPHCRPIECAMDSDCMNGGTCTPGNYCIEEIICAGLLPEDASVDPYKKKSMVGLCDNGATCAAPSTCMNLKVCIPPNMGSSSGAMSSTSGSSGNMPDEGVEGGCGCIAVGSGAEPWAGEAGVLALLGAILYLGRRRSS